MLLNSKVRDPDLTSPLNPATLTYGWSCINLNLNEPCKNANGELIDFSLNSKNLTIPKLTFEPYFTLMIEVNAMIPNGKSNKAMIIVVVTELDIPVLEV